MLGVGARLPACAREPIPCGGRGRRRRLSLPPCSRPQIGPYRDRRRQRRWRARRCGDAGDPRRGLPQPGCGWCISPWVDMEATGETMVSKSTVDPTVQKAGILDMARLYLNAADPRSPLAAPIYADLTGLAPLLIQVGAAETLLDDAIRLARVAGGHA